jgi:hypothetical protein
MKSVRIRYRPIRIGWCVRENNLDDLRKVLRWTHCFWAGRYNPVIPLGDERFATELVDLYRVDALFPAVDEAPATTFIEKFPHLRWPHVHESLFIRDMDGHGLSNFLDIYHPVRRIFEEHIKNKPEPAMTASLFTWDDTDPLRDVFTAQFGAYPAKEEIHIDYATWVEKRLKGTKVEIPMDGPIPKDAFMQLTPSALSAFEVNQDRGPNWDNPGFYVGDAADFMDLVHFWNLRAATVDLIFLDAKHEGRLLAIREEYLRVLLDRPRDRRSPGEGIGLWSKRGKKVDLAAFQTSVTRVEIDAGDGLWNGLNLKPPLMYLGEDSVLCTSSEFRGIPSLSFELRQKPFYDEVELHNQVFVAGIRPLVFDERGETTFDYPFLPELNDFYRRDVGLVHAVRSEIDGVGLVTDVTTDQLTISSVSCRKLISTIFGVYGITANLSEAGRIASSVIQQLGGVQGGRVFKIAGVRALIEKYKPSDWFTRSGAIQIIGQNDPVTGKPNFEPYEHLFIESREGGKLKPQHAFDFLLKHNVFRVGCCFVCPRCELQFWSHLDDIETKMVCEYCGERFNVTTQLHDGGWAYRRSGLFGREDHQQGAIPVALTLQQLATVLHRKIVYSTSMTLEPNGATIEACETDFVVVSQREYYENGISLAIGECKSRGEITDEDVRKLSKVADALPAKRIRSYIVFAKTSPFSPDEIQRCRAAQPAGRPRVILLSDRELEPYFVYERAAKEFEFQRTAVSLEGLAQATHNLYFQPKPRRH